jgi:hypothetical protein
VVDVSFLFFFIFFIFFDYLYSVGLFIFSLFSNYGHYFLTTLIIVSFLCYCWLIAGGMSRGGGRDSDATNMSAWVDARDVSDVVEQVSLGD